jgi:hypothetical protein
MSNKKLKGENSYAIPNLYLYLHDTVSTRLVHE